MAQETPDIIEDLLGKSAELMQRDFVIPTYKGVSTAGAKSEVKKASSSRDELGKTVTESRELLRKSNEDNKAAIDAVGKADSDKAYADAARAEVVAQNVKTTNALFGVDADQAIGVLTKDINIQQDRLNKLKPVLDQELAEIKDLQSVGPLDDPLAWLFNGIQLPSRIQKYNTTATQYDNDVARIEQNQKRINDGLSSAGTMGDQINKGVPTITAAQAKATADKAVAEANKLKVVADINYATHSVDFANKKLAGDLAVATATIHTTQLDIQQTQAKYQSEVNAINLADTHATRLLKAAELYEKLEDIKQQKIVIAQYETKMGMEPGTLTPAGLKAMSKEKRDMVLSIGLSNSFGVTALDAFETFNTLKPGPGISPDTIKGMEYIGGKLSALQKNLAENAVFKSLSKEEKRAKISEALNGAIALDVAQADKPGNYFHEFSPAKMLMADKDFAQSALGKILKPLADKDQEITTKTIASTILESVGGNPSNAGVALSSYYKDNMELRNKALSPGAIGIKIPEGYIVHHNGTPYNMVKPGDATKYALEIAKEQTMAKYRKDFGVRF